MLLAGLGMAIMAEGCQGMGGSSSSGGGGPSLSFGQNYVPPQSEPPVEEAGAGRQSAARSASSDAGEPLDGDDSNATARRKSRWLAGSDKDAAPRKTLPVSARSDSFTDDEQDQ